MDGPVRLETDRLVLRRPEKADAAAELALLRQEFVRRYNCLGKLPTTEQMEEMLTSDPGSQLVLCLKEDGTLIGHIGIEPDSLRYRVEAVCLDYYLGERDSRKGYMSEALECLIGWLFREGGVEVICARSFTENAASLALLHKLGFTREGTLRRAVRNFEGQVFDDALFSLLRSEYPVAKGTDLPKLGDLVTIKMDRPIGTEHPKHPGLVYPVNYGYVPGLIAPDGEEQDAYVLGVNVPLAEFSGRLIAVIHRFDDVEEKWVLAPEGASFTKEEIAELTRFQEQYYHTEIRM